MGVGRRWWVLALASVASIMAALDTLVVATALSTIQLELDASIEELEWTVNAYNLSFAVLLLPAAALGDRFGRRRMFASGMALFTAASAACAMAPGIVTLIAARAVQGAGAALLMTLALALVSAAWSTERRAMALGVLTGLTGLSVAFGPVLGGAVADGLAWEWIFWLNVPIGVAALPLVLARIPESFGPDTTLDLPGLGLVTGGALGVVWALVRGNPAGWTGPEVLGSLGGGLVLLAAFVWWQLRAREPMLPMRFFRSRAFSVGNAGIFFAYASLFGAVFFFAQFLQNVLGYGPLEAGLRLLPWTGTLFFCAPIAGALVERFGERPFLAGGLLIQTVGLGWIALIADPGMAYSAMVVPLIVAGCGISMTFPAVQNSVVSSVPADAVGKAAGVNSTMRELGGVFGIAALVAVFSGQGAFGSPQSFTDGFAPAIALGATFSLIGAVIGVFLPGRSARLIPSTASARQDYEKASS